MKKLGLGLVLAILLPWGAAWAAMDDADEQLATAKLTIEEARKLLVMGRAAWEDGLYPLAQRKLEELVDGAPDRRRQAEGALWLAQVQLAAGRRRKR